jgi:[ribosomal protein S5]-alanine N-acetyltransferase
VLELERLRIGHEASVLEFETANREFFARTISDRGDEFFEQFHDNFQALLADQRAGECMYYVVVQSGSIVGRINLYDVQSGSADVGYRIAEQAAGRGVATFALRELCRRAFDEQGLTRLTAKVSNENIASQRVLEHASFAVVGPIDVVGRPGIAYERALASATDAP